MGTAGLAWERHEGTDDRSTVVTPPASLLSESDRTPLDKFGWVAGVGAEAMLGNPNWIGRVEYLHYDLGQSKTGSTSTATAQPSIISTAGSQTIDVVRAGVSYKFGEQAALAPVPYAKAPVAAPVSGWAGFYMGAHGGYAWGNDPQTYPLNFFMFPPGAPLTGTNSKGWIAGGHFGHNWQYDRAVAGLEADLSAADINGNTTTAVVTFGTDTSTVTLDEKVKYLGTVRGRLGWLPTETVLLYGTAGLAWERFERGQTNTLTRVGSESFTTRALDPSDRFGWVAGVGGEVMLGSPNWIGRLEYLHYDFGRVLDASSFINTAAATGASITTGRQTIDLVRAGVSYKFGPDGPVVAAAPAIYAKAPPVALQSWAGLYIGGHGGYGWKENDFTHHFFLDGFVGGINSKGWLAGGQAGYNSQYASVVAGVEIDGSATGIKGSSVPVTAQTLTETQSDNVKYLGTVRGRLGWTPAATWLLYGTGGLAWERVNRFVLDFSDFGGGNIQTETSDTPRDHFGWAAGAGVESFIGSSNWIGRLEYLHYDFGTVESTLAQVSTMPGAASRVERGGRQTIDTVRAGVSYKFTP
jgi:opacity protein-like surface antigen